MKHRLFGRLFVAFVVTLAALVAAPGFVPDASPSTSGATAVPSGPRSLSSCSSFLEIADVSMWQGDIDWPAYASQRPGVIIKLGGADAGLYRDPKATRNVWGASAAGVLWGGYYFADPRPGNAAEQARHFVSLGAGTGTLPDWLDLEYNRAGMSGPALDQWSLEFAAEYHRLVGHQLGLYVGAYFHGAGADPRLAATFGLWIPAYLAGYDRNPNPCTIGYPRVPDGFGGKGWDLWQFTSSNTAAGIAGNVDMNVVPPEVWAEWTGAGVAPNAPASAPAPAAPQQIVWGPGSRGPKVAQIQAIVGATPDGVYGPETARKVQEWQEWLGVPADGVWGPQTDAATAAVFDALAEVSPAPGGTVPSPRPARPTLQLGARNLQDVCDLQALLIDSGHVLAMDCVFGWVTQRTVMAFQAAHGLVVDGVVGPATWGALGQ